MLQARLLWRSITHAEYSDNSGVVNQTPPSRPATISAVASASTIVPFGPITVADFAPIAIMLELIGTLAPLALAAELHYDLDYSVPT